MENAISKHIGTTSIGQLKISIASNIGVIDLQPKAPVWKPFNQCKEFERKAKESVLYDLETPILDKYLTGGKKNRNHHHRVQGDGRGSQLTNATMNSVATNVTNDSSLPCVINIL